MPVPAPEGKLAHGPPERDLARALAERVRGVGRITRGWATISTVAAVWIWLLTCRSVTGAWVATTPGLVLLLLFLLAAPALLWFFYGSIRSLLTLPHNLKEMAVEGRAQSAEVAAAFRDATPRPGWRRAWTIFRALLELRGLVFRSRGLLAAAGLAVKFRIFNPLFLAVLVVAFLASAAIVIAALAATLLALAG